jgi:ribonuclease D
MKKIEPNSITIFDQDIPTIKIFNKRLSIDTETDGLEYRRDKLRLVQLCTSNKDIFLIRNPTFQSKNLLKLLQGNFLIFHHAAFDMGFLYWHLGFTFLQSTVECTKTLSKIIRPKSKSGLGSCLKSILNINIPKDRKITTSNWNNIELTPQQIQYAINDVLYLENLYETMMHYTTNDQYVVYSNSISLITQKTYLEVQGYEDVLEYSKQPNDKLRKLWLKQKDKFIC